MSEFVIHIMQYIARQTTLQAEQIEILAFKGKGTLVGLKANADDPDHVPMLVDPHEERLEILDGQETLAVLKGNCKSRKNHLVSKHLLEMW